MRSEAPQSKEPTFVYIFTRIIQISHKNFVMNPEVQSDEQTSSSESNRTRPILEILGMPVIYCVCRVLGVHVAVGVIRSGPV